MRKETDKGKKLLEEEEIGTMRGKEDKVERFFFKHRREV